MKKTESDGSNPVGKTFGTIYVEKIRINLAFREVSFFVENKKMLVGKKKSVPFYEFLLFYGNCLLLIRKKNDYFRMFLVFLSFSNKAKMEKFMSLNLSENRLTE